MSVILGLGLASIFRRTCFQQEVLDVRPSDMATLKDDVYEYDGKCYKYQSHAVKCDKTKTLVH